MRHSITQHRVSERVETKSVMLISYSNKNREESSTPTMEQKWRSKKDTIGSAQRVCRAFHSGYSKKPHAGSLIKAIGVLAPYVGCT